ncbi:hypothetical protein FHS91_002431 [Sphingobium xanthum]|uniref:hypothetical protein n=1 Tax=Sphingobium xanthum TaxID=1387165 RepID=UPI001C8BDBB8|nr:hypothetical protein [Sphingobium xanthum]
MSRTEEVDAEINHDILPYACDDVVVIGRIKSRTYRPIEDPDDILGHGWIDADIIVRRVVKGSKLPFRLPVKYIAHVNIRSDRDFMFVLTGDRKEGFEIQIAQLMDARPRLAATCE